MSKKLTILFAPMDAVGHVNSCIGLAEALQSLGHKIVFVVSANYKGKLSRYGFIEELLVIPHKDTNNSDTKPGQQAGDILRKSGLFEPKPPLEGLKRMRAGDVFKPMIDDIIATETQLKGFINKYKPDVYVVDNYVGSPAIIYSDKPWVQIYSPNPLFVLQDERTPPGFSGLPSNGDKNSKEWKELREASDNLMIESNQKYNEWLKANGFPTIDNKRCIPDSRYLNLYAYPAELDYTDIRPLPNNWFGLDSLERKGEQVFEVPDKVKAWIQNKEKLIYLSLGSMGSMNVELMKRLVNILSKCEHKFIVSKGLLGDDYQLADNMWGQNSVPQTNVLPLVDVVITHGGNNTVTETFSAGKAMIIMPLFADQFDNAQRVQEKGFGVRLDAHTCTEEELLGAINKLLNDKDLKERLSAASKRMANSDSIVRAAQLIEGLVASKIYC